MFEKVKSIVYDLNVVDQMTSYGSAQTIVLLTNIFVIAIISPILIYIFSLTGFTNLSSFKLGNVEIGRFIEAILSSLVTLAVFFTIRMYFKRDAESEEKTKQ